MLLLIFLFGLFLGLLGAFLSRWVIQVKCPTCKQLKPLPQIILFNWKKRSITGQPCPNCQKPKPQIEIEL